MSAGAAWSAVLLAGLAGWVVPRGPAMPLGGRPRWSRPRRGDAVRREQALLELLEVLTGELRAGAATEDALRVAAGELAGAEPLVVAATRPGGEIARELLAVLALAETTGAALVDPVARLMAAHRARLALRRELAAELAGPRATWRLLAGLPVAALLLGVALGADPVGFLLGTAVGRACLVTALALVATGSWWSRRIVRAVG